MSYRISKLLITLFTVMLMVSSVSVLAQTSLWQVKKGDRTLYLGGTVHVLGQEDYPLPDEFEKAFSTADKIVFETDLAQARSPAFSQRMMQQMLYPSGQSLKDVLDKQTYKRLAEYCADKVPMSQIEGIKPAMVVLMLTAIEFQRVGMVIAGVDEHFWALAVEENKQTGTLESIDEQLSFIVNMGKGNENELIQNTLDDIKRTESMIAVLKAAWRSGDEAELEKIILQEMIADYPELYQNLLVRRNNNWLPYIEAMLQNNDIELVLVGALHLIGDDGLLQLLRNKGYDVTLF
ncbi:MAG: TraB/GumN family protein [Gammaproteobacteria bacterium]|nr:TraB/GumN family protein [Gammaproteobacteria bacterium]